MKYTLGKIIILFILSINLLAQSHLAKYDLISNKKELVVKEAVKITFIAHQLNHEDIMYFFLEPKVSENYKIVLLNKEAEETAHHHKTTTFTFLLYPLLAGDIKIDFDFTIKTASDEAVAQIYRGGRDNVQWIETSNTKIKLEPLVLKVKELTQKVDLVGDFHITSRLDKRNINSYESANIKYRLYGTGYDDFNLSLIDEMKNVKIFVDKSQQHAKATPDGYIIDKELNYALISSDNIKVQAKKFKCYSPKNKKFYTLTTQEFNISVIPIQKSTLIDTNNSPEDLSNFTLIQDIFIYLLLFLSGYLSAKLMPPKLLTRTVAYQDIRDSKNAKELLFIIMHRYDKKSLQVYYEILHEIVYNNADSSQFKQIKKQILKALG